MPTAKKSRYSPVVSVGCGWRKSRSFFNGKQRLQSPKPLEYQPPPDNSPSRATKQSSSDDLGLSVSSSETFPLGKCFSDELSATTDDDDASFSTLLRQLNELERSLLEWTPSTVSPQSPPPPKSVEFVGKLGKSLVVVKASNDPLADFRSSMLEMIVEKEIVAVDGLRELLRCFLSLNSAQNHPIIIRAFFEIWTDFFSRPPEKLRRWESANIYFSTPRRYLL